MGGPEKRYIIGIDLGTTNSAVAYVDLLETDARPRTIRIFKIPQVVGEGEVGALPVLPSFLYIHGDYDLPESALRLPWTTKNTGMVGAFARDHGALVPIRLVSSAKSWLCHPHADRHARMLPWGAGEEVAKVSPVQATASYLDHIRKAWNASKGEEEDLYLENQLLTLTVPASFDEVARDLTLEAARLAGFSNVTLLEEPLAAFYNWLYRHESDWMRHVTPGELILVCDVGGGTTDFTLITLREVDGSPRFERIAVGDHLILGGDNIDLALARKLEAGMDAGGGSRMLRSDRWRTLCHHCRKAKEVLLEGAAVTYKITLMGKGKKLIADTFSTELSVSDVLSVVLEGFFPLTDSVERSKCQDRKGISEFGLPYESEPAITRHLGWFLDRHRDDVRQFLGRESSAPDLILYNGGSLKSSVIQERIRHAIRRWHGQSDEERPKILENPEPDLAVALGAAYYGLVKLGRGVRVGSGSPRSYYLGVAADTGGKEWGGDSSARAVCLVERGLQEGARIRLTDMSFDVLTNQPVSFDLYSSSFRSKDRSGDMIAVDDTLSPLPPFRTVVQFGKKGVQKAIPVQMEAEYTEMGTLAVYCRSQVSDHRWRLRFQLRREISSAGVAEGDVFDDATVGRICGWVNESFSTENGLREADVLTKKIAAVIDRPKERWPLGLIRSISDVLLDVMSDRTRKSNLEARWLNLIGFCLRPGFGDGPDSHRIKQLWKIYSAGPIFANSAQVRAEWWILWRRVAGGMNSGQQRQCIQDIGPVLLPKKGIKVKASTQEQLEMWMAVANMERLLVKDKVRWGRHLLAGILSKRPASQLFWALSRIGARELLYGSIDRIIPPEEVMEWIDALIDREWTNPQPVAASLAQLARKTGDRARDLNPATVQKALDWMNRHKECGKYVKFLTDVVPIEKQEETLLFGESLPTGIVLRRGPGMTDPDG